MVVVLILVDLESNMLQGAKLWIFFYMFGQFGQCVLGPVCWPHRKILVETAAKFEGLCCCQSTGDVSDAITSEQRNSRTVKGVVDIIRPVSAEAIPKYSKMLGDCWMV